MQFLFILSFEVDITLCVFVDRNKNREIEESEETLNFDVLFLLQLQAFLIKGLGDDFVKIFALRNFF